MNTKDKIYRLLPTQVPRFWEAIKFSCMKADNVMPKDMSAYFNDLLQDLLSDKAQCFVVLDDKKVLHSIAVTKIMTDKLFRRKDLFIQCLYSVKTMNDESLAKYFSFITQYAVQEGCHAISFNSSNPRIWEIAKTINCSEQYRNFVYPLGG